MSQRSSIIIKPSGDPITMIRGSYLKMCDGDHCMAALLAYYEFKLNGIISTIEDKMVRNPNLKVDADDFFIECSISYIKKGLQNLFGRNKIIESNEKLHQKGFITIKIEKDSKGNFLPSKVALNVDLINNTLSSIKYETDFVGEKTPIDFSSKIGGLFGNKQGGLSENKQGVILNQTTPCLKKDRNSINKENISNYISIGENSNFSDFTQSNPCSLEEENLTKLQRGAGGSAEKLAKRMQQFEEWYSKYPRKDGKADAMKKFQKLKEAEIETIIIHTEKYAEIRKGKEKQYTLKASNYLSQRCWEDEDFLEARTNNLVSRRTGKTSVLEFDNENREF